LSLTGTKALFLSWVIGRPLHRFHVHTLQKGKVMFMGLPLLNKILMHFEDHSLLFHYQETMYLVILDMHTFMQSVTDVKDVWLSMLLPGAFTVQVTTPHWG
jgi:hypothetical protein